jgi:glycosyltransferase involved in cell wall biosynthesis
MNYTLPYVSVIIPVLNGERTIKDCLNSLLRIDYPPERREILIIDNGSTDKTAKIVEQYPVRRIVENRQGLSYARNCGIDASDRQILAFTDADCIVTTGWLRELVRGFDNEEIGVVVGEVVSFPPQTSAERYTAMRKPRWQTRTLFYPGKPWFLSGCAAFHRKVFEEIGQFDTQFAGVGCEDIDFSWRFFHTNRFKLSFQPKALVFHRHRLSARGLFKQYFRYGQGQNLLKRKHPHIIKWGLRHEVGAYLDLILTALTLCRSAIRFIQDGQEKKMTEFDYQYFELIRKLSERIGFTYGALRRFTT